MTSGIYCIRNKINGKMYIGSATNLRTRWAVHTYDLRNNKHGNKHLQYSWNKYGGRFFVFEVLEEVSVLEQLVDREQFYLDSFRESGKELYNISERAGSQLGFRHSEESRRKMSQARAGRINGPHSPERIANISKALKGRTSWATGKKFSEEYRMKISKGRLGITVGPMSEVAKHKISKACKGRPAWNKGVVMEKRPKMSRDKAELIIRMWESGDWSHRRLATEFDIGVDAVCRLANGKVFVDIPRLSREEALHWLMDRSRERTERGVEGTQQV